MHAGSLLYQGAELMLVGMGTVFAFLSLLVIATTLMSRLVQRYLPESEPAPATAATRVAAGDEDAELIAAIGAAIHMHRSRRH